MHTLATLLLVASLLTAITIGGGCWLAVRAVRRAARRVTGQFTRRLSQRPTWSVPISRRPTRHAASWPLPVPRSVQVLLPRGQVAAVRRELASDTRSAARAVRAGRHAGRPVQELERLAGRLRTRAAELDLDLAVVAAEPDPMRRRRLLADLQDEVTQVRGACRQVRDGVHLAGGLATGASPLELADEVHEEVQRLALWASSYRELRHG